MLQWGRRRVGGQEQPGALSFPHPRLRQLGIWVLPPYPQLSLWPGQRCWLASAVLGPPAPSIPR